MTKEQALYAFWSSFALPAYEESAVQTGDDAPDFPYITYQANTSSFGDEVELVASLWYRSSSWTEANAKKDEISRKIGAGGINLLTDNGAVWLNRGNPFAQPMGDPSDNMIRRIALNLTAEFWTAD